MKSDIDKLFQDILVLKSKKEIDSYFFQKVCVIIAYQYAKIGFYTDAVNALKNCTKDYISNTIFQQIEDDYSFAEICYVLACIFIDSGIVTEEVLTSTTGGAINN